ncbi:MAG: hypothetical protein HFJ04_04150 [Lachnospiraceae bacterium]|nr:hypothetical protein [Lachnospiraceae bacterium]
MLHVDNEKIRSLLLKGKFGLEKESLRIDGEGFLAHTVHPFSKEAHIVRDFCENQTEINTPAAKSAAEAIGFLEHYYCRMQKHLAALPDREYLWPFSNPPYIRNEDDIPIARFEGAQAYKTDYREYLSARYGRYKMCFSGVHVNYSFAKELLLADFALSGETDFRKYKDRFYVELAERVAAYGWLLVAVTAASPLLDGSFVEKKQYDKDTFTGLASIRCSELGYWNYFTPMFDYTDLRRYTASIRQFVEDGLLKYPSELYYPVRLKPGGEYSLEALLEQGVDHIELRMFDLNPLVPVGVDVRDVLFAQFLLVWLAGTPRQPLPKWAQVQAVQNFKNAAHYDLKTVNIVLPEGDVYSVIDAGLCVLSKMQEFYRGFPKEVRDILEFERAKFTDHTNRYAWKVRREFEGGFVKKGVDLAKERQKEAKL